MDGGAVCRNGRSGYVILRGVGGVLSIDNTINWGEAFYLGFAVIAFAALCGAVFVGYQLFKE